MINYQQIPYNTLPPPNNRPQNPQNQQTTKAHTQSLPPPKSSRQKWSEFTGVKKHRLGVLSVLRTKDRGVIQTKEEEKQTEN